MKKMNPVVHFEMPYEDKNRMAIFYAKVFGWDTEMLGKEMGDYVLVATSERNKDGMPKNVGTINGGFYEKSGKGSNPHPSIVIAVDDIEGVIKKIIDEGGKIVSKPMDIPGYGLYASLIDSEGNRVGMMQPYRKM